jgi:hypothetical protein
MDELIKRLRCVWVWLQSRIYLCPSPFMPAVSIMRCVHSGHCGCGNAAALRARAQAQKGDAE